MRVRLAPLSAILAILAGCAAISGLEVDTPEVDSPPFPECRAESYAFAGRGTFAGLGLVGQSAAPLPDPNREAMIWVTRDGRSRLPGSHQVGPPPLRSTGASIAVARTCDRLRSLRLPSALEPP